MTYLKVIIQLKNEIFPGLIPNDVRIKDFPGLQCRLYKVVCITKRLNMEEN